LEQEVADYLSSQGYSVRTNQTLTGRSGAPHEIDVLAERQDSVVTTRLAVECKAWGRPIEKDVVAKLHLALTDLGIGKGLVVCTGGYTSGAHTAAQQLGIDLWDDLDLRKRLGAVTLADTRTGISAVAGPGIAFSVDEQTARRTIGKLLKATKGRKGESQVWFSPAFLPCTILTISSTSPALKKREAAHVVRRWDLYELVTGAQVGSTQTPFLPTMISFENSLIRARLREEAVVQSIEKTVSKLQRVNAAIPLTVESWQPLALPFYLGLFQWQSTERIVAIDGIHGGEIPHMSLMLTSNIHWIRESLSAG
jgi:hypothetical protein